MYIVKFYYTNTIIAIESDFSKACEICDENENAIVRGEDNRPLYYNLDIPF